MEHWIDVRCRDCGEALIEHRGVWISRRVPTQQALVNRYRDDVAAQTREQP